MRLSEAVLAAQLIKKVVPAYPRWLVRRESQEPCIWKESFPKTAPSAIFKY